MAAAVAAERLTIARDLHDLVSHGLGLITVRAAVARSVDATSPDRLMAALGDIEQASRATTLELRRMLQVLRSSQSPPLSPAPGAPNWQESITAAERAGLTVEAAGTSVAVNSNGVALAVHRILQEGLANVTRHAGPTKVRIDLTRNGDTLCLTMADEGPVPGWRARPGAGHGLLGLQERVAALGGELSHSSSPAGFRLVAELPAQSLPMPEIRVVIADDQQLLRQSLVHLLDHQPGIRVVAEAATGVEAVSVTRELAPDVVLMDIRMPQLDGIAATRSIARDPRLAETRVLVLTMFGLDEYVFGALRAGASGFLLKDATPDALINAVRTVAAGQSLLAPSAVTTLVERWLPTETPRGNVAGLTPRQTQILRLVARGLSNEQIEQELHISHATCKTHISALLSRLQARDRAQLVIAAYENGLVSPGSPS